MMEEKLTWSNAGMNENRYNMAGWLAIAGAIIFPVAIGIGIMYRLLSASAFGYRGPDFWPTDILMILFTAIGVYVLIMFRRLLHENYDFHELDLLITVAIIWSIAFQAASFGLKMVFTVLWPISDMAVMVTLVLFIVSFMVTAGIIDIIFAVKLFKIIDKVSGTIKVLAYITMVSGILEVTVILCPIAMLLIPITFILYGLIFLRANQEVEFV